MSEESNYVVSLESTCPTLVTTVLPTNQIPWKTYYRRNLEKKVRTLAVHQTLNQDFEPLQDQGMIDSIDSHINNRMSEND